MKWMLGLVALSSGCGSVQETSDAAVQSDGPNGDAEDRDARPPRCDASKPFAAPVALTELNTQGQEHSPTLTPDELTIVFNSGSDLSIATRTSRDQPFGAPALLAGINTNGIERRPSLTGDGLALYVEVFAPGVTIPEIRVATRANTSTSFGAHLAVGAINAGTRDVAPFVIPDHSAIYFVSDRTAKAELLRSSRTGTQFGVPAPVTGIGLQDGSSKEGPTLTPDELVLYFSSDRASGAGGYTDIYVATRSSAVTGFGAPTLMPELNSAFMDTPGWVSADNCVMYMSRSAGGTTQIYDLYVATRPM